MKKLAIFVEGQTELFLVQRLLLELFGYGGISIESQGMRGKRVHELKGRGAPPDKNVHYALIVDCSTDGRVKPAILERAGKLQSVGFELIIGLRDLFPTPLAKLEELKKGLATGLNGAPVPLKIFIAIMEIESWFLGENIHFKKLHKTLTPQHIHSLVGFNPETDNPETIYHPSSTLDAIYSTVGLQYKKKAAHCLRTIDALDFENLYVSVRARAKSLEDFVNEIEQFYSFA